MSRLRLDLIVRRYEQPPGTESRSVVAGGFGSISTTYKPQPAVDRWTWRLWSGSRIVSTSGAQLFSRRIDCAHGAEVGAGLNFVVEALKDGAMATRGLERVPVRILDERVTP